MKAAERVGTKLLVMRGLCTTLLIFEGTYGLSHLILKNVQNTCLLDHEVFPVFLSYPLCIPTLVTTLVIE